MATTTKHKRPDSRQPFNRKTDSHRIAPVDVMEERRSVRLAAAGLQTASDVANFMLAVASEVITEQCKPKAAVAASSAIGKALKAVELQMRYGKQVANGDTILKLGNDL